MLAIDRFVLDGARVALRRGAARQAVVFALVAGACVAAAPVAAMRHPTLGLPVAAGFGAVLVLHAAWTMRAVRRLSRRLAEVTLSPAGLTVRDAGGRERRLAWTDVQYVDVTAAGVVVAVARRPGRYVFGPEWPESARLARRLVRHADAHGRPLRVDGVACGALSLTPLRPALDAAS